jgi:mannose-6-phosphate isomerase-like protein (cupin superfamily)
MRAHVVDEHEVAADRRSGDTAEVRVMVDATRGSDRLEQRVIRFGPGRSQPQALDGVQGLLYVASGEGNLMVGSDDYAVGPDTGAYFVDGESFEVDNPGPDEIVAVLVTTLQRNGAAPRPNPRVVRYGDRPPLPAGKDREFRYLGHRDTGCPDVTQFVGTIPPGRAPDHSHAYDEVIYVIEGQGTLHVEGRRFPIRRGTCMHLPPLLEHALENEGDGPMRVLGVFHPSGDPASRAYEANE